MSDPNNKPLTSALAQLRSDDVLVQNQGVEAAIQLGSPAIPGLLSLLADERGAVRSQAMYALAQIAAPEAAQAFQRGLQDSDERVRAYAAQGLARLNHPQALDALLKTLNDAADELHNDITPAVQALGEAGLRVAPRLLDLLMDEDTLTRLHAQRALESVVSRHYGFRPGQGFPTPQAEEQAHAAWRDHGNYDYAADPVARAAAVSQLRQRLATLTE